MLLKATHLSSTELHELVNLTLQTNADVGIVKAVIAASESSRRKLLNAFGRSMPLSNATAAGQLRCELRRRELQARGSNLSRNVNPTNRRATFLFGRDLHPPGNVSDGILYAF